MKLLKKVGYAIFIVVIILLIVPPAFTNLLGKPVFWTAVKTYSMSPAISRGDMVFLLPVNESSKFSNGDIIVFSSIENGIDNWTLHRIIGGDKKEGFISKGDANALSDQEGNDYPLIKPEWIAGKVPLIGGVPIKIPFIGLATLFLGESIKNPLILPSVLGALALVLILDEILKSRKKHKKDGASRGQLYFLGGLVFTILIGAVMLMGSLFITFFYGVGKSSGVLMGSDIGILPTGSFKEISIATIKNDGILPSNYYIVSDDPQVTANQTRFFLKKGENKEVIIKIFAENEGIHEAHIKVAMFLPFFPPSIVGYLISKNYWLGLVLLSFLISTPFYIIPFLDYKYRTRLKKEIRKKFSRI